MNKKIIAMKEEKATLIKSIRDIIDAHDGKEMPQEKKNEIANLEARGDVLEESILREEKQVLRERELITNEPKSEPKSNVSQLFAGALSGRGDDIREFKNVMTLGTDATAGYLTAPVEFVAELIKEMDNILFMKQICKVIPGVQKGQSLGFPFRNAAAADATWVGEVTTAPEETTLSFGRREFKPNKMAKLIKLSKLLVENSDMAAQVVKDEMAYRIGTGAENAYMNGNGTAQPLGIFTASASGIASSRDVSTDNTATTVTFDGLMNAKFGVKQQYLARGSWVGHRDLAKMVAKIKDGDGQYIWSTGVVDGQPDKLLGAPFYMSEYAPATFTTGLYVGVFGDFNHYWITESSTIELQILNELYALENEIGYLTSYFGDGAPVVGEAFSRVKLG